MNIEWLEKSKIEAVLSPESRSHLSRLELHDTIDSTNTYLLSHAKAAQSGFVCLAEEQTQGRGRQGKEWFSPKGTNLYCSLLWQFPSFHADISHLSLAIAVMLIKALQAYGIHRKLELKWPNDIYCDHRKLAGILIEGVPSQEKNYPVVIGVGLNVQLPSHHPFIQTSIDMKEIVGGDVERNKLTGLVIDKLLSEIPRYIKEGFSAFLPDWRKYDVLRGKLVVIRSRQYEVVGIAEGVNENGELMIRDQYGKSQSFRCGEVSVRLQQSARC